VSALPIANTDRRTTEHSTSDSLGNISWIQKAALQHVQNHIARDSVYQAFPCISTASNERWCEKAWVRGYTPPTLSIVCRRFSRV